MSEEVRVHATATDPLMELLELDIGPDVERPGSTEPARRGWTGRATLAGATAALALAALALGVALSRPSATAVTEPEVPTAVPAFAEMYVSAYLTASGPEGGEALRSFYPAPPDLDLAAAGDRFVTQVVTTAVSPDAGAWRVETAATVLVGDGSGYVSDGIHHYVVGVVATDDGLAAASLPGRVPAPAATAVPATVDGAPLEDESLRHTVEAFLAAYLLGAGELGHLVTPGSGIVPVTPPPYRSVAVGQMTSVATADNAHHIRVTATASPRLGSQLPIELHLLALTQSGAWKIATLSPLPPLRS